MKRKRHEICSAVPGTGVNIYEVRLHNQAVDGRLIVVTGTKRPHPDVPCGPAYSDLQRGAMFATVERPRCCVPADMLRHLG